MRFVNRRTIGPLLLFLALTLPLSAWADTAEDNIYLETVGGFSGSYIYTTYAYIGATADAYAKDIYPASQVKVMMDEKVQMIKNLVTQLQAVQATNIVAEDKQFISSMIEILTLLQVEAESLASFASTNDQADVERYDQARKQAWPKIKKLLGIQ